MPGIKFTKKTSGSALSLKGYYPNELYPVWDWGKDNPVVPGMEIKADHVQKLRNNADAIRNNMLYCSCTCDCTCTCTCQCQCTCTCTCTCNWF